jgi:polysaccharide export outer membrane protein
MRFKGRTLWCVAAFLTASLTAAAMPQAIPQVPQAQQPTPAQQPAPQGKPSVGATSVAQAHLTEYVLGPNDEISILSVDVDGLTDKPIRINTSGDINVPQVGKIHVVGLTVGELEEEITKRLERLYKKPDITVMLTALKSQPVTVIGLVHNPNTYQLEGRKTLVEVLTMAGGPAQEASSFVTVTRQKENGRIPLPTAKADDDSSVSTVEVNWRALQDGLQPQQNIQILPYDVISVRRAPIVYAVGQLNQQGKFALTERDSVSIKQLIAWAGGKTPTAASKNAKIIRPSGATVTEVAVNLDDIMSGKAKDIQLQAEDILFVPESNKKRILNRSVDSITNSALGLPFYLLP